MSEQADPSVLDQLYGHLADATNAEEDLAAQHQDALAEISEREDALTQELAQTDQGSERAQQIQADLDELRRAFLTIREQLGPDDSKDPDAPHQPDQQEGNLSGQRAGDGEPADEGA